MCGSIRLRFYTNVKQPRQSCLDCANRRSKEFAVREREKILLALGLECKRCGFSDPRALQIDHVYGDGRKERTKKFRSNYSFYRFVYERIVAGSDSYQLLCANCNQIKRVENQETGFGIPRRIPA